MQRVGVLMPFAPDDPETRMRVAALEQGLRDLGWVLAGALAAAQAVDHAANGVQVTDPLGSGFVPNLARPGGNLTGQLRVCDQRQMAADAQGGRAGGQADRSQLRAMLRRCCSRLIALAARHRLPAIYPLSLLCRERRTDVLTRPPCRT